VLRGYALALQEKESIWAQHWFSLAGELADGSNTAYWRLRRTLAKRLAFSALTPKYLSLWRYFRLY
ncbi:MAG: hypothetical protein ACRC5A_14120, partial [Enterobacteriaceae bacterium]